MHVNQDCVGIVFRTEIRMIKINGCGKSEYLSNLIFPVIEIDLFVECTGHFHFICVVGYTL